jgi:peptidase A4-like protein
MLKTRFRCGTIAAVFLASGLLASAQTPEVRHLYDAYANVPTEITGVYTYKEPPAGFSPTNATDEQLAMYGFPPRPDKATNPKGYETWAREMSKAKTRWKGPLKYTDHKVHASQSQAQPNILDHQDSLKSLTWSGVVNYKPIKKFSDAATAASSFSYVATLMDVPVVNYPYGFAGLCGYNGNVWLFVGIDGTDTNGPTVLPVPADTLSGELLAAGVFGYVDNYEFSMGTPGCYNNGPFTALEIAWFPTTPYNIQEFTVNPGDDVYISVHLNSSTTATVYTSDDTQGVYGTYQLQSNFPVLGSTVEYIAARLDQSLNGSAPYLWQLNNFTGAFFAGSGALDFDNKFYGPGTNTINRAFAFSMTDDAGDQIVSQALAFPQAISTTNYGDAMYVYTENCAASAPGCTP